MSLPSMPSSNPLAQVYRELEGIKRLIAEVRSSMGVFENATVGSGGLTIRDQGGITVRDGGQARFYHPNGELAMLFGPQYFESSGDYYGYGLIIQDDSGLDAFRATGGDPAVGRRVIVGQNDSYIGRFDSYSDITQFIGKNFAVSVTEQLLMYAKTLGLNAESISLNPTDGVLTVYNLPTTSGGYLLRYNQVGGNWTMALDSSSKRYKTNIEDAAIDPADVLKWRPRRWQDINQGEDAPWNTGLIAEEVDEAGTPEFVIFDDEGRPDGIRKEILAVGHQVVLQDHEQRIADLEAENAALKDQVAALAARLDALEAA